MRVFDKKTALKIIQILKDCAFFRHIAPQFIIPTCTMCRTKNNISRHLFCQYNCSETIQPQIISRFCDCQLTCNCFVQYLFTRYCSAFSETWHISSLKIQRRKKMNTRFRQPSLLVFFWQQYLYCRGRKKLAFIHLPQPQNSCKVFRNPVAVCHTCKIQQVCCTPYTCIAICSRTDVTVPLKYSLSLVKYGRFAVPVHGEMEKVFCTCKTKCSSGEIWQI